MLSTSLSYPFFFHHSFSSSPSPLPFFFSCVRSNAIHRRRAREASLPFSSVSTRLIARSRTTGIELLAVGDPLARLLLFFLFAKPALLLLLLVSSRRPARRTLLCPLHRLLIRSMIKFTVVNGGGTKTGSLTAVRFFHMTWDACSMSDLSTHIAQLTFSQVCCRGFVALCPMRFRIYNYFPKISFTSNRIDD